MNRRYRRLLERCPDQEGMNLVLSIPLNEPPRVVKSAPVAATHPEPGSFYSVWERESKRHKWILDRAFVLCTRVTIEDDGDVIVSWQESGTGATTGSGWTAALIGDLRELRAPAFDVPLTKKNRRHHA